MVELQYVGPDPAAVGCIPLPEGWPASRHPEADEAVAKAKLSYRFDEAKYRGWGGKPAYRGQVPVVTAKESE